MSEPQYVLFTERRVVKYIQASERAVRHMLSGAIAALVDTPHRQGKKLNGKLKGYKALDDLSHQGVDYRVIFRIDDNLRQVRVMDAGTHEEYNTRLKIGF